jgi:Protein of unknown function (DUF3667)
MTTPEPAAALPGPKPACLNCGAAFGVPRPRFCPACGQESNVKPPTLGEFVQQFGGAYFATEGALWRTLKLLLFRPGELTRQYLAGRRKHYVLPLRLYLSISLVTLLLLRVMASGMEGGIEFDGDLSKGQYSLMEVEGRSIGPMIKDGVFSCGGVPPWVCKRLERRFDTDPKGLQRQTAELGERAVSNIGAAMFVMLPLFAAWLKLVYLGRRLRYTEHLVFALHLHSFWFLMWALMLPGLPVLGGLAFMAVPVYALWSMKRVYGGRWWPLLLRSMLLSGLYMVAMVLVMLGVGIWALLA